MYLNLNEQEFYIIIKEILKDLKLKKETLVCLILDIKTVHVATVHSVLYISVNDVYSSHSIVSYKKYVS